MARAALVAMLLVVFSGAANADDPWLIVRPGMAVQDHLAEWRGKCGEFVLSDDRDEENYLTCHPDDHNVVTANIAPNGVAWWSRFWGAGDIDRTAFVSHFQGELGLSGAPFACSYFNDPAQCWNAGPALVTIPETDQGGRWTVTMEDRSIFDPD